MEAPSASASMEAPSASASMEALAPRESLRESLPNNSGPERICRRFSLDALLQYLIGEGVLDERREEDRLSNSVFHAGAPFPVQGSEKFDSTAFLGRRRAPPGFQELGGPDTGSQ